MIIDFDLDLLKQLINIIDYQLEIISQKASNVDDADSLGYYDSAEHITGLGFVACQTYMSSVYGYLKIDKQHALSLGPLHSSGQTKVQIINHVANYWKHNNEWSLEKEDNRRKQIEKAFESVGFPVNTDYPISGVLYKIVYPDRATFEPIITILELWRNELLEMKKNN